MLPDFNLPSDRIRTDRDVNRQDQNDIKINEKLKEIYHKAISLTSSDDRAKLKPLADRVQSCFRVNNNQDELLVISDNIDELSASLDGILEQLTPDALDQWQDQSHQTSNHDLFDIWVSRAQLESKGETAYSKKITKMLDEHTYECLQSVQETLRNINQALIYPELSLFDSFLDPNHKYAATIYLSKFTEEERKKMIKSALSNCKNADDFFDFLDCVEKNRSLFFQDRSNDQSKQKDFKDFFYLLNGDVFIQNTEHEKGQTVIMIDQLKNLMKGKTKYAKLYKYLQSVVDLKKKDSKDLEKNLRNLKANQSLLVLAGWKGESSSLDHGLSIEFSKNTDDTFDIKIINTGDGLEYHPSIPHSDGVLSKKLIAPLVYKNVPPASLGLTLNSGIFTSPDLSLLLKGFSTLLKDKNTSEDKNTSPAKSFYCLCSQLDAYKIEQTDNSVFYTPQRSGTSSLKSILMALRGQCKVSEYKELKQQLKYESLCKFYKIFLKDATFIEKGDKDFFIDACSKFIRSLAKTAVSGRTPDPSLSQNVQSMLRSVSRAWIIPQEQFIGFTATTAEIPQRQRISIAQPSQVKPQTNLLSANISSNESMSIYDRLIQVDENLTSYPNLGFHQFEVLTESIFSDIYHKGDKSSYLTNHFNNKELSFAFLERHHKVHAKYYDKIRSQRRVDDIFSRTNLQVLFIYDAIYRKHFPEMTSFKPFKPQKTIELDFETKIFSDTLIQINQISNQVPRSHGDCRKEEVEYSDILSCLSDGEKGIYSIARRQWYSLNEIFMPSYSKEVEFLSSTLLDDNISSIIQENTRQVLTLLHTPNQKKNSKPLAILASQKEILEKSRFNFYASAVFAVQGRKSISLQKVSFERDKGYFTIQDDCPEIPLTGYIDELPTQELSLRFISQNGLPCIDERQKENVLLSFDNVNKSNKSVINNAAPSLACRKNLYDFYNDRFSDLTKNAARQECFQSIFLFKANGEFLIEEVLKQESFRNDFYAWIDKGIKSYCTNPTEGKPDVGAAVFFLDLFQRSSEFLTRDQREQVIRYMQELTSKEANNAATFDPVAILRPLLSMTGLKREEKLLLHTMNILLTCKKIEHVDEDLTSIAKSWFFLNDNTDINKELEIVNKSLQATDVNYFIYKEEMIRAYQSILPSLKKIVMEGFFQDCPELGSNVEWNLTSFPSVTNQNNWLVDFASGQVYSDGELILKNKYKSYTGNRSFEEVFEFHGMGKERNVESHSGYDRFEEAGHTFKFIDEKLQVLFDGTWYQYRSNEATEFLPDALLIDHHVFDSGDKIILLKRKDLNLAYKTGEGNELINHSGERKLKVFAGDSPFAFIEHGSWTIVEEDNEGKNYISLPRLKTSLDSEECLSFYQTEKDGHYYYGGNSNFYVDIHAPLSAIPTVNHLRLESNTVGGTKVLIPVVSLETSGKYASKQKLQIKEKQYGFSGSNLRKKFTPTLCAMYSLSGDSLTAESVEYSLHLAYLYLANRQYQKALNIINGINAHIGFSEISRQVLERIINAPLDTSSSTASSVAVALKAYCLLTKNPNDKVFADYDRERDVLINKYRGQLNNVEAGLHLDERSLKHLKIATQDIHITVNPRKLLSDFFNFAPIDILNLEDINKLYKEIVGQNNPNKRKQIYFKHLNQNLTESSLPSESRFYLVAAMWPEIKGNVAFSGLSLPEAITKTNSIIAPFDEITINKITGILAPRQEGDGSSVGRLGDYNEESEDFYHRVDVEGVRKYIKSLRSKNKSELIGDLEKFDPIKVSWIQREDFVTPTYTSRPEGLISFDTPYDKPLYKEEFVKINDSIKAAQGILDTKYTLIEEVKNNLSREKQEIHNKIEHLELEILQLSSKRADDPTVAMLTEQMIVSKTDLSPTIPMLVTAFLDGKYEGYSKINPDLSRDEIIDLDRKIMRYLSISCDKRQIERTLAHQDDELAAQEIASPVCYESTSEFFRLFLVFEYRADLRMRQAQVNLLGAMLEKGEGDRYKNLVAQMMMGGGKTSVLTSILMHKACQKGRIPVLIAPIAQYETLVNDLALRQQQNFYSKITPINVTREDLTFKNLKRIQEGLQNAKQYGEAILTTAESVHIMQLELEDVVLRGGELEDPQQEVLAEIMRELRDHGDLLIDEVDVILSTKNEMIFPYGEKIPVSPQTIQMVRQVIEYHLSGDDPLKILENKQSSYGRDQYVREVLPTIEDNFFKDNVDLERYHDVIMGKKIDDLKIDNPHLHEGVMVAKEIFNLLPITLEKSALQKYDRIPGEEKVIPYIAAGHPSRKEFGSNVEATLYHFQTILAKKVELPCLELIAKRLKKSALFVATNTNSQIEDTHEYQLFQKITGTSLIDFCNDEGVRNEAIAYINGDYERLLDLEELSIEHSVGHYEKYLASDSQRLVSMFNTVRGFSGTPWNQLTYDNSLQSPSLLEPALEGQILLSCHAKESPVHIVTEESIQCILGALSANVTGYIDACGMLKEQKNEDVARYIIEHHKDNIDIQAVLYFNAENKLCALQKLPDSGVNPASVVIGSSSREVFKNKGIDLDKCFVYYDERHCEATDIPQKDDAVNGLGFSHKTSLRTLMQSQLRLRKFLKNQNVEYIISDQEKKHFSENVGVQEIITKAIINQADDKCEEYTRSVKHKLLAIVKNSIFNQNSPGGDSLFEYSNIMVSKIEQRKLSLDEFFDDLINKAPENLKEELDNEKKSLTVSPYYQEQLANSGLELTIETQTELQTEVQTEVNLELEQEFETYQRHRGSQNYTEKGLPELRYLDLSRIIDYFKPVEPDDRAETTRAHYLSRIMPERYQELFPDNINITTNYGSFKGGFLNIFHKSTKPIKQILIIKENTRYQFVLLSAWEGGRVLNQIKLGMKDPNSLHLVLPDGKTYDGSELPLDDDILDGLWHVNFLAGNLTWLLKDLKRTRKFMLDGNLELRKRYLQLACLRNNEEFASTIHLMETLLKKCEIP